MFLLFSVFSLSTFFLLFLNFLTFLRATSGFFVPRLRNLLPLGALSPPIIRQRIPVERVSTGSDPLELLLLPVSDRRIFSDLWRHLYPAFFTVRYEPRLLSGAVCSFYSSLLPRALSPPSLQVFIARIFHLEYTSPIFFFPPLDSGFIDLCTSNREGLLPPFGASFHFFLALPFAVV